MKKIIRKQFFWMRLKAVLKIIIPITIAIIVFPKMTEELETAGIAGVCCTVGLIIPIYGISGILTLKNGTKQIKEYMRSYPGGEAALGEEFENAIKVSGASIGQKHLFANASDGFYIIPFAKIKNVYVRKEGENRAKGRPGYYYLYVKWSDIGGRDGKIKVYYMIENQANEAMELLIQKTGIVE